MLTKKKAVKLEQRVEKDKKIAKMVKDIEEEFNEGIIDEYHKLASELGYSTPQIVREKLLRFLKKNNLKVYDRLKVEAFLDGQYGEKVDASQEFLPINDDEKRPGWCWVGLTSKQNGVSELRKKTRKQKDEEAQRLAEKQAKKEKIELVNTAPSIWLGRTTGTSWTWGDGVVGSVGSGYSGDIESGRTYKKEIPMRVLQLISAIKKEIPELSFFISAVAIPKPDPFLYVTCEGMEGMILAHWDEPNFID